MTENQFLRVLIVITVSLFILFLLNFIFKYFYRNGKLAAILFAESCGYSVTFGFHDVDTDEFRVSFVRNSLQLNERRNKEGKHKMSRKRIKSLKLRKIRQALTTGLTNKERQSWGDNGRQLTKNKKPKCYFSLTDKKKG